MNKKVNIMYNNINISLTLLKFILIIISSCSILYNKFFHYIKFNIKSFLKNREIFKNLLNIYNVSSDENDYCKKYDPFTIYDMRFNITPLNICEGSKSKHICYKNTIPISGITNGVICLMENVVIDPFKWKSDGFKYLGPVNNKTRGIPLLQNGFFNMKCNYTNNISNTSPFYKFYFKSWNYNYNDNTNYKELSPNKVVFFVSRNQDSPNLYWGGGRSYKCLINDISF